MKIVLAQGVTQSMLDQDPTKIKSVGDLISKLLPYVYVAAGLAMFVMLVLGGLELMLAGGDSNKTQAGYGKLKGALVGFLIVFLSYAVIQLVEVILNVKIL